MLPRQLMPTNLFVSALKSKKQKKKTIPPLLLLINALIFQEMCKTKLNSLYKMSKFKKF